jgi:uroporphyrinogen decarboxylase
MLASRHAKDAAYMPYDVDVQAFWRENELCLEPFSTAKPRLPLTFWLDDHYMYSVVDLPSTERYYRDFVYRLDAHRRCNEQLRPILGRDFYPEDTILYQKGEFEVLCGARRVIEQGMTPWIESSVTSIEDVKVMMKRLIRLDVGAAAISDSMRAAKRDFERRTGAKLVFGQPYSWNGPATVAANILGTTNLCYFMLDETDVMTEFMAVLADRYIEYRQATEIEDYGCVARSGVGINDDCCYLFPPRIYEKMCAPFLAKFFAAFAPNPTHKRRQHSDSSMAHLMPILNDLGINEVNFGPAVDIRDIRRALPKAVIHGQIPPFLLRDGKPEEIVAAVRRDFEAAGADGGLVECPAGAVVIGTPMENLHVYMWAVQTYGRYS